ncbi:hypothetical protein MSAN_02267700 [Mycena sanguinolenta]|uniref:DUF6593 domain-containing protein n=1 Tax=Mycena sanguinolenta TaxID=230812 RepID=A0A8H6XA15_9AGAR|nr:hypothetical protein MSAN_02267700 [Mycena sanguinolenta]
MFNPYGMGDWPTTPHANTTFPANTTPQPSIFGALPYPTQNSLSMFISFRFTSFSPTILNSTVVGPQARTYFRISTDVPKPGFTVFSDAKNEPVVIIEWLTPPVLEIRDTVSKQKSTQWLPLSAEKRYRTMTAKGTTYVWAPDGESLCLYASGLGAPQICARVTREDGAVLLEVTAEIIRIGLLDVCVAAAFLLQCGRTID